MIRQQPRQLKRKRKMAHDASSLNYQIRLSGASNAIHRFGDSFRRYPFALASSLLRFYSKRGNEEGKRARLSETPLSLFRVYSVAPETNPSDIPPKTSDVIVIARVRYLLVALARIHVSVTNERGSFDLGKQRGHIVTDSDTSETPIMISRYEYRRIVIRSDLRQLTLPPSPSPSSCLQLNQRRN